MKNSMKIQRVVGTILIATRHSYLRNFDYNIVI